MMAAEKRGTAQPDRFAVVERARERIADPGGEGARTFTRVYAEAARQAAHFRRLFLGRGDFRDGWHGGCRHRHGYGRIVPHPEMAAAIKQVVDKGDYASTSEVVREAIREWKPRRQTMLNELAMLKEDIDKGLADVAVSRVQPFDADRIIERGRQLLDARSS